MVKETKSKNSNTKTNKSSSEAKQTAKTTKAEVKQVSTKNTETKSTEAKSKATTEQPKQSPKNKEKQTTRPVKAQVELAPATKNPTTTKNVEETKSAKVSKEEPTKPAKKSRAPGSHKVHLAHGVGRRKAAIARVWLQRGNGKIAVNESDYISYFDTDVARQAANKPFILYPQASQLYDVNVNVYGGGLRAQADALKLGLARALCEINPEVRPLFREHGLLTVDSRVKERKKYGQKGARRKFQFVKR